jgi:hypothetical protein
MYCLVFYLIFLDCDMSLDAANVGQLVLLTLNNVCNFCRNYLSNTR